METAVQAATPVVAAAAMPAAAMPAVAVLVAVIKSD
jgi:hypothetical protein